MLPQIVLSQSENPLELHAQLFASHSRGTLCMRLQGNWLVVLVELQCPQLGNILNCYGCRSTRRWLPPVEQRLLLSRCCWRCPLPVTTRHSHDKHYYRHPRTHTHTLAHTPTHTDTLLQWLGGKYAFNQAVNWKSINEYTAKAAGRTRLRVLLQGQPEGERERDREWWEEWCHSWAAFKSWLHVRYIFSATIKTNLQQ